MPQSRLKLSAPSFSTQASTRAQHAGPARWKKAAGRWQPKPRQQRTAGPQAAQQDEDDSQPKPKQQRTAGPRTAGHWQQDEDDDEEEVEEEEEHEHEEEGKALSARPCAGHRRQAGSEDEEEGDGPGFTFASLGPRQQEQRLEEVEARSFSTTRPSSREVLWVGSWRWRSRQPTFAGLWRL